MCFMVCPIGLRPSPLLRSAEEALCESARGTAWAVVHLTFWCQKPGRNVGFALRLDIYIYIYIYIKLGTKEVDFLTLNGLHGYTLGGFTANASLLISHAHPICYPPLHPNARIISIYTAYSNTPKQRQHNLQ